MMNSVLNMLRVFAFIALPLASVYGIDWPFLSPDGSFMPLAEANERYTCCIPLEWEGLMYLDYGTVFIDQTPDTASAYFNGTVHTAWSFAKKKFYLGIKGVEQSPLIPKPVPDDSTILYDYANGVMYTVSASGECQKGELGNMTRQCIPDNAKLISRSVFGDSLPISTYRYKTTSDTPWEVTATVFIRNLEPIEPRSCTPVQLTYFTPSVNPDSGSYYTLQITDVGPIKTPGIFDVPKPCQ